MAFLKKLEIESTMWMEKGLISPEQQTSILALYSERPSTNWTGVLLASLAALLVGVGVVSLVAFNWDSTPKWLKLLIAVLPLVATQAALLRGNWTKSAVFQEVAVVLNGTAILVSLGLVSQIYQIQGSTFWFLIISMAAYAPVVLLTRSLAGGLLFTVLISLSFFFVPWKEVAPPWTLLLFLVSPLLGFLRNRREQKQSLSLDWTTAAGFTVAYLCCVGPSTDAIVWPLHLALLGTGFTVLGTLREGEGKPQPFRTSGKVLLLALLGIAGFTFVSPYWFPDSWTDLTTFTKATPLWTGALFLILALVSIAGALVLVLRKVWNPFLLGSVVTVLLWLVSPWIQTTLGPLALPLVFNLVLGLLGLSWILDKEKAKARVLGGTLLLLFIVNQRFFDSEFSLLMKGLAFVASGLALWGVYQWRFGKPRPKSEGAA